MEITRDFKIILLFTSAFLVLLAASIYKDKLLLFSVAVVGAGVMIFLIGKPVRLIYAQIIFNLIIKFSIEKFGVPSAANYITDVLTIVIIFMAVIKLSGEKERKNFNLPILVALIFFLSTVVGIIINQQSIMLYIWGIRNNFRFYGFFFGCVILLEKKQIDKLIKIIIIVSVLNVFACLYQYFVLGIYMDSLGGIFGTNVGVNSYLNIFMCITTVIILAQFLYKKRSVLLMIFLIFSNIFIAAISELKAFYIELIIIVVFIAIFSKPNKKTLLILIASTIGLIAGIQIFYLIFPSWQDYFSIQKIIQSNQTYATNTDLGRANAISRITNLFFQGSISKLLFGLGLGSAETSQIPMFNSQFFYDYGSILHYHWLSQAFIYIETGWMGLICFFGFFIFIIIECFKIKRKHNINPDYYIIAMVFAVICCFTGMYNGSLRTEAGYMAYFILSIPFVLYRNEGKANTELEVIHDKGKCNCTSI